MRLSTTERLILINQLKILEKLYPEEADSYAVNRKALEEGYVLHYEWIFEWLFDEMSEDECREVIDILDMYSSLLFSYQKLLDKDGIEESDIEFRGFDGNTETKQLSYATYFMHDLDRFNELHDNSPYPNYNSHCPMLGKYRLMIQVWKSKSKNDLTKEDILEILGS